MKIKALGAVRTVTGSSFRIETSRGHKVLLDCGLFQGGRQTELRNTNTQVYDPLNLTSIVITHAHMDHSGLVPRLVRGGYNGPVYATEATCDLLKVLWLDAANIQEQEAVWKSRKNRRQGKRDVEPLYTEDDARKAMNLLSPVEFETLREVAPGVIARFFPAGHILGAASVHFTIEDEGRVHRVAFSGDIGRNGQLLMPDPSALPESDTVFMETTYGNREHKEVDPSVDELIEVINQAHKESGKILIPAFAVERTQELLLLLARAWHGNKIPRDMPIFLDSPLATAASQIYARYVNLFDEESRDFLADLEFKEALPTLRITKDAQESQKLNDVQGPAIIIAGSGMANAGRILHHLKHNLWRPNCHVIFIGFQAQGTTGRRLVEGAKVVKIFREPVNVEAQIHTIGGFSAHAGRSELLTWLGRMIEANPKLTVNLIHGEESGTKEFSKSAMDAFKEKYPEVEYHIPTWLHYAALADETETGPDESEDAASLDAEVKPSLLRRIERLKELAESASALPPDKLSEFEGLMIAGEDILNLYIAANGDN